MLSLDKPMYAERIHFKDGADITLYDRKIQVMGEFLFVESPRGIAPYLYNISEIEYIARVREVTPGSKWNDKQ